MHTISNALSPGNGDWELFSQGISAQASMWDMQEESRPVLNYRNTSRSPDENNNKQTNIKKYSIKNWWNFLRTLNFLADFGRLEPECGSAMRYLGEMPRLMGNLFFIRLVVLLTSYLFFPFFTIWFFLEIYRLSHQHDIPILVLKISIGFNNVTKTFWDFPNWGKKGGFQIGLLMTTTGMYFDLEVIAFPT